MDASHQQRTAEAPTPSHTHADLAVKALDAGKHVVTEKVMCLSIAECDRMIAAAESRGRLLTVFQNRRLEGDYLAVKSLTERGCAPRSEARLRSHLN